ARQGPGSRHPKPQTPQALYGGPSRRTRLDSAARRHDRVPLAGERRERPPVLPGRRGAWNPDGSRRLLRYALAFPPGLCRRRRQFLQAARALSSILKGLVSEDGHSMTESCCKRSTVLHCRHSELLSFRKLGLSRSKCWRVLFPSPVFEGFANC